MTTYNYYQEETNAILEFISENYSENEILEKLSDEDVKNDWKNELNDDLWNEDSITGNASGSYTFNRWKAEEYVKSNIELLISAYQEFDSLYTIGKDFQYEEYEKMDVTIRCFILWNCIDSAIEQLAEQYNHEIELVNKLDEFMNNYDYENIETYKFDNNLCDEEFKEELAQKILNHKNEVIEYLNEFSEDGSIQACELIERIK